MHKSSGDSVRAKRTDCNAEKDGKIAEQTSTLRVTGDERPHSVIAA